MKYKVEKCLYKHLFYFEMVPAAKRRQQKIYMNSEKNIYRKYRKTYFQILKIKNIHKYVYFIISTCH